MPLPAPRPDPAQDAFRRACAEVDRRLRAGERGGVEERIAAWPLAGDPELAVELIFTEFVTREELGQSPRPDEFYARFPTYADRLRRVFDVDQLLRDTAPPGDTGPNRGPPGGPPPDGFGRYELREKIGSGGMGVVYKAWDRDLRRVVAIKVLQPGGATDADVARLRKEAEAVARLNHPNVVQIYEVGEGGGRPYLALEFVDGPNLGAHAGGRPMAPDAAAELVETIATAVHHAHDRGIVHRDLKPANVLVSPTGPKVTDFGLAARVGPGASAPPSGPIIGTAAYMPPEQAEAVPGWVSPAADVYALGVILYELLTGRPPFLADTPLATLNQLLTADPVPPRALSPGVSRDLETVCLKCLRKVPGERYATAAALAGDLSRVRAGEPISARPAGAAERLAKWARRRPAAAAALAVAAAAAAALVTGQAAFSHQLRTERDATEYQRVAAEVEKGKALAAKRTADAARAEAEALLATVRGLLYADQVARSSAAAAGDPGAAALLLADTRRCRPEDRDFAWRYVKARTTAEIARFETHTGGVNALAASDDGTLVVTGGQDGAVHARDGATGSHRFALENPHAGPVTAVAVSADGSTVVTAGADDTVRVWNGPSGESRGPPEKFAGRVFAVAASADGKTVAAGGPLPGGGVGVRVFGGRPDLTRPAAAVRGLAFSPDGTRLAVSSADRRATGEVAVWDLASGTVRMAWRIDRGFPTGVAFSPDGSLVAAAVMHPQPLAGLASARVWDATTGAGVAAAADPAAAWAVRFTPDGTGLAVAHASGGVTVWDVRTGRRRTAFAGHEWARRPAGGRAASVPIFGAELLPSQTAGACVGVAFAAGGRRVVSAGADRTFRVWDADPGRLRAAFTPPGADATVFAPARGIVFAAANDRTLRAWDPRTGRDRELAAFDQPVTGVATTDDGSVLIAASAVVPVRVTAPAPTGTIRRIDPETGATIWRREAAGAGGRPIALSRDGQSVVCPTATGVISLDAATGIPTGRLADQPPGFVTIGPGAKRSDVWVANRERAVSFTPGAEPGALVPLPRGTVAAAAGGDRLAAAGMFTARSLRTVSVLDRDSGRPVSQFEAAVSPPDGIAVSPDGKTVATTGPDGVVRLWHAATGQELLAIPGGESAGAVRFGPDGATLYARIRDEKDRAVKLACWFAAAD